jgi:hypothetical protein
VKADLLSRIVWQLQTRAGVEVHVRISGNQTIKPTDDLKKARTLFSDLGASVPLSGLFIDDVPALARLAPTQSPATGQPWETRAARDRIAVDALPPQERMAILAFREVQRFRPWSSLTLVTNEPSRNSAIADLALQNIRIPADGKSPLLYSGRIQETVSRRSGIWLTGQTPPAPDMLRAASRRYQQLGGTALGWCPDSAVADLPLAREIEPDISASTFPVRF